MTSFKLRGPSNSSLRDPANSTLRGSDGILEFLKSLESTFTFINSLKSSSSKSISLLGILTSSIRSNTAITAFSASFSTISNFVKNVRVSRDSTITTNLDSQNKISHGVTVGFLSDFLNIQRSNRVNKNIALIGNSFFQKINAITINQNINNILNLIYSANKLISFNIQSSFASTLSVRLNRLLDILISAPATFTKNVYKSLNPSGSLLTLLITPFTKFIQLSILLLSNFDSAIIKNLNKQLDINNNLTPLLKKNLQIILNNISSLFTIDSSAEIFKTISIANTSFILAFQKQIFKFSTIQISFNSYINKLLSKVIELVLSTFNQFATSLASFISLGINSSVAPSMLKSTNRLLSSTVDNSLQIPRLTKTTLLIIATQSVNLVIQSLRLVSLAIIFSQNSSINFLVGFNLNKSIELLATVNKSVSLILESVLTSFQLALNKSIFISKNITLASLNSVQRSIDSSLSLAPTSSPILQKRTSLNLLDIFFLNISLTRTAYRLISLAISSLLSPVLSRKSSINISLDLTDENKINKSVDYNLQLISNFLSLITIQSLRFVSLAVLSGQNVSKQLHTVLSLENSYSLFSTIGKQSFIVLKTISSGFALQFNKLIFYSVKNSIDYLSLLSKTVSYSVVNLLSTDLKIARSVFIILSKTVSLTVSFIQLSSLFVSIAVNNLFDTSIVKLINTSVNASINLLIGFNKVIDFSLILIHSLSSLLSTQSSRFVSLIVNNNYLVSFARQVSALIQNFNSFNLNVQKQVTNRIFASSSFINNSISNTTKSFNLISISTIYSVRLPIKNLGYSSTMNTLLSPGAFYDQLLNITLINTVNISTQSLRFVSLAIVSAFNSLINRLSLFLLSVNLNIDTTFVRKILIYISSNLVNVADVLKQSFRFITIEYIATFNSSFIKNIVYPLSSISNLTVLKQTRTDKIIENSFNLNVNFARLIDLILLNTSAFSTNVSRGIRFLVNLNVLTGFNNLVSKSNLLILQNELTTSQWISKSVGLTRSTSSNFSILFNLLNLTIVNLQIISEFASNIQSNTSKFVEATNSLGAAVLKSISIASLNTVTILIGVLSKRVSFLLESTLSGVNNIQKLNFININSVSNNLTDITFNVAFTINSIVSFGSQISKAIFNTISIFINTLFSINLRNKVNYSLDIAASYLESVSKVIVLTVQLSSNFISLISIKSFRLISLAIISNQDVKQNRSISSTIQNSFNLVSEINRNTLINLQVLTVLFGSVIKNIISLTLAASSNLIVSINRSIQFVLSINIQFLLNISSRVFFTVSSTITNLIDLSKLTEGLLSISLNTLFDVSMSKSISSTLNSILTGLTGLQKRVASSLQSALNLEVLISKQLFAFLSMAIVSAQNTVQQNTVFTKLTNTLSFVTSVNTHIALLISLNKINSITVQKLSSSLLSATTNLSNSLNRVILYSIKTILQPVIEINIRSFRFISFAILSNQNTNQNTLVSTTLINASIFNSLINRKVNSYLQVATDSFNLYIQNAIDLTRSISIQYVNNISKAIDYLIELNTQQIINIALKIVVTLSSTLNEFVQIVRDTSAFVVINLSSSFDVVFGRYTRITINTSTTLINNLQNLVKFNLKLISSFTGSIFNQSLRFLSFAIISLQNVEKQTSVSTGLSNSLILLQTINNNVFVFVSTISNNLVTSIQASVSVFISLINNLTNTIQRLINYEIQVTLQQILDIQFRLYINLVGSLNYSVNLLTISARLIALSIVSLFDITINRSTQTFIDVTTNLINNTNSRIQYGLNQVVQFSSKISTQSLRFVSFVVLSVQQVVQRFNVNFKLSNDASLIALINRRNSIILQIIFNNTIEQFKNVFLNNFYVEVKDTISFNRSTFFNIVSVFTVALNWQVRTFIAISNSLVFTANIIENASILISLALSSLFDTTIRRLSSFNIKIDTNFNNVLIKSVQTTLKLINNFVTSFSTLSLRFVSLAILSSQNVVSRIRVSINLINVLTTVVDSSRSIAIILRASIPFIVNIVRSIFFFGVSVGINLLSSVQRSIGYGIELSTNITTNLIKNISYLISRDVIVNLDRGQIVSKSLGFTTAYDLLTRKLISRNLEDIIGFNVQLIFLNSYYLTFNLITGFDTNFKKRVDSFKNLILNNYFNLRVSVNSFIQTITEFNFTFSKQIFKNITDLSLVLTTQILRINYRNVLLSIDSLLQSKLIKSAIININLNQSYLINLRKAIAANIRLVTTLTSLFFTKSLRLITFALVNQFEVVRINKIASSLKVVSNFAILIKFNLNIVKLLSIIVNLPVRRSHTLFGVLTSFAVNKSQPGSDGSAQQMQRKPGGSARKRNINNNSSTLFRRGNTDDLE